MRPNSEAFIEKLMPSKNKAKYRREVPPGCISIYRVNQFDGRRTVYHGVYRSETEAYVTADALWREACGPWNRNSSVLHNHKVRVDHKAAVLINGQFFIVNLDPIKFAEPNPQNLAALLRPAEEQAQ